MFTVTKIFKKILPLFLCVGFFLPLLSAQADGGMIPIPDPSSSPMDEDVYEPSQTGLIAYSQGQEDLYLKANYQGSTNNFIWVVPTPHYPKVEKAPEDIFKELSIYTTYSSMKAPGSAEAGSLKKQEKTNVIVHEQKQVGIYEISVLSAKGEDELYQWLKENNYPVTEDIKPILDWYIEKEWYFTAMRINPENELKEVIKDFDKEVDANITEDNLATQLAHHFSQAIDNNNLEKTRKIFDYFVKLAPKENKEIQERAKSLENITPSEFKEKAGESLAGIELTEAKEDIYSWIQNKKAKNSEEIDKYNNYIHPVKISFNSSSIVYPLKISRISTRVPQNPKESLKTNEVLLYVLSQEQVKAPGFQTEYNEKVTSKIVQEVERDMHSKDLDSLQKIISNQDRFLTKMRRTFAKKEMDEDVYIIPGKASSQDEIKPLTESYQNNSEYQEAKQKIQGSALADRLKGRIVIKTEDKGKAYYVNPTTKYSHYLGRPVDAFRVMRNQGVGIKTSHLSKIPMSLKHLEGADSDGDGLPDRFEKAIGTNIYSMDTDQDGYNDKEELKNNNDPTKGNGATLNIDKNFAEKQKGKILLQVENHGEAWYVNPEDGRRYFLGRPADAFQVMKSLGAGISNKDFKDLNVPPTQ